MRPLDLSQLPNELDKPARDRERRIPESDGGSGEHDLIAVGIRSGQPRKGTVAGGSFGNTARKNRARGAGSPVERSSSCACRRGGAEERVQSRFSDRR